MCVLRMYVYYVYYMYTCMYRYMCMCATVHMLHAYVCLLSLLYYCAPKLYSYIMANKHTHVHVSVYLLCNIHIW